MLVSHLTREVEAYADRLLSGHPLIELARRGTLPPAALAGHLNNIRYSIQYGYRHMRRARRRATELGLNDVAEFVSHKFREEYGHDRWALDDVQRLRADFSAEHGAPSPSTAELMEYIDQVIERDPRVYLAYMFFVEYLTVLAGPALVHAVEQGCGIPASYLSVVARHVELDKHHVQEALSEVGALAKGADPVLWAEMLSRAMDCFERACNDVVLRAA